MQSPRRFALAIVLPPLAVALPVAIAFLIHVTRVEVGMATRIAVAAGAAYIAGAIVVMLALARAVRRVRIDLDARRDPSESVSRALSQTVLWSAMLWIGWGLILGMAGAAMINRTLLGLQYFAEASLIVAAPAMAWSYWVGKRLLVRAAAGAARLEYRGRMWSIGAKIAIVFIGFSIVSTGALVLVISSRVATRLGEEVAYEIGAFGLGVALVTTFIFALATWFLARDITAPMNALVRLAQEMAEGRFTADPRIFSDDEAGKLTHSFGVTRLKLRGLIEHVGDSGESITEGVRRMTGGTDSLVDNAHEQSGMASRSSDALIKVQDEAQSVLREADRVADLTADSAGRATELRASVVEVSRRMDELFHSVEKSSAAATEIDASARETASRTMTLASIGNDVVAFVAEMDATADQITQTAQQTAALSTLVRNHAAEGRVAVDETVDGIRSAQESTRRTAGAFDALQKSLGQIDQILLFIDDVTNRTNLLSLNAAIIAAQAGRQDHGFSVIAEEIRQLADRTRNATKEIAGIIRNVQPIARQAVEALEEGVVNVDRTVELAHNAATALVTILGSADRSLEMTQSITRALEEQSKASHHLHNVAARMSENIAEMHRATEGQAVATRMLAAEAERVSDIALQVKRATTEQTAAGDGIAKAMEQIANDVLSIRDRLDRQLRQAEQIAAVSKVTLSIAERNRTIAEQFRTALQALLHSGREFEAEVARFRE